MHWWHRYHYSWYSLPYCYSCLHQLVVPLPLLMSLAPILICMLTSSGGTATTTHVTRYNVDMHVYVIWWHRYHYAWYSLPSCYSCLHQPYCSVIPTSVVHPIISHPPCLVLLTAIWRSRHRLTRCQTQRRISSWRGSTVAPRQPVNASLRRGTHFGGAC